MKRNFVLMLTAVVISADSMEMPSSRNRLAEQLAAEKKVKREAEQAAIIREPAAEVQPEGSPEVQAAIKNLREVAEPGEFPNEIGAQMLKNLAKVKVTGATEEQRLYNAIANIRNFMDAFPQFYGDVGVNGFLIQELAKRYMPDVPLKVAIALATTGAGNWLVNYVGNNASRRSGMVDYLIDAAGVGELAKIRFILSFFPLLVNEANIRSETALIKAAEGHQAIVEKLLQMAGISMHAHNQGAQALHNAAQHGRIGIVELLLQIPEINVNAQTQVGDTALIVAAGNGHTSIVERLLQVPGINVNVQSQQGKTALVLAVSKNHTAVIERLLQAPGIDINAQDGRARAALSYAVTNRNATIIKRLLQVPGINVNAANQKGFTALMLAAVVKGDLPIVELLLQAPGIEINARTNNELTVLGLARQSNNPNKDAIIKRLIEFGAIE